MTAEAAPTQPNVSAIITLPGLRWLLLPAGLVLVALMAFLLLWRLDQYPAPWFDEGAYLNVARTYAEEGIYAERSSDGYRFNAAVISVGPTVILPIAGLYALFGESVLLGRLVIVGYGLLLLLALFGVTARLLGVRAALVALLLAFFGWGNWMPLVFRTVMGEVVAVCYLLAGLWLWLGHSQPPLLIQIGTGIAFGLAAVTKTVVGPLVIVALGAAWVLNLIWYRRYTGTTLLVPALVAGGLFALWTYFSAHLLGAGLRDPAADRATLSAIGSVSYFKLEPGVIGNNVLAFIGGSAFSGLFIPALILGAAQGLQRTARGAQWGLIMLLVLGAAALFVLTGSTTPETNRGAVLMYLPGAVLVTALLHLLTDGFRFDMGATLHALRGRVPLDWHNGRALVAAGLLIVLVGIPALRAVYNVTGGGSDGPYRVAAFLDDAIPPDALIETWDREFAVLTDHRYHFPPPIVQAYHNAHLDNPANPPAGDLYDFRAVAEPDVVLVGPMSRWAGLYPETRLTEYEVIYAFEETYVVYARR